MTPEVFRTEASYQNVSHSCLYKCQKPLPENTTHQTQLSPSIASFCLRKVDQGFIPQIHYIKQILKLELKLLSVIAFGYFYPLSDGPTLKVGLQAPECINGMMLQLCT